MQEAWYEPRESKGGQYSLTWRGRDGNTHSAAARGLDISPSGLCIGCASELKVGSIVHVQARVGSYQGDCELVQCSRRGAKFHLGLEFREEIRPKMEKPSELNPRTDREPDHYETLQISRKADVQTIHRVFRIMASRFHPDNPETGDVEQFLRMKRGCAVLSQPERRLEYDATLEKDRDAGPRPIFALKDFVAGLEAESKCRLGFPREYLSFIL